MADDLDRLIADLETAGEQVYRDTTKIVEKGAVNVKREWRKNAKRSAGAHGKRYPRSITYDIYEEAADLAVEAEIGPDKDLPQGALGNLIEFGSVNNPPNNDGGRALRGEAPRLEEHLGKAGEDAIK